MLEWLRGVLREKDGTPSAKRAVYALAVAATLLFCSYEVWKRGLNQQVAGVLQFLTGGSAGAYAVSRFAETKDQAAPGQDGADKPPDAGAAP